MSSFLKFLVCKFRVQKSSVISQILSKNISYSKCIAIERTSNQSANSPYSVSNVVPSQQRLEHCRYIIAKTNEEKQMRNLITIYLSPLLELYKSYACLTVEEEIKFEPIMIRLFLWQFYTNLGVKEKGVTLVDIDNILAENEESAVESKHDPFEPIYFWQFIQSLIGACWLLYLKKDEHTDCSSSDGILSHIVKKFLDEVVFIPRPMTKGLCLSRYLHLLPIDSVYQLYLEVGNPPTARDFLLHTCVQYKRQPPCTLDIFQSESRNAIIGFNTVPVGHEIIYMPEPTEIGEKPRNPIDMTPRNDRFYKSLKTFRVLGAKKILNQITKVCPQIKSDGMIIDIDYPLTFLEFYEALILCTVALVKKEDREERKLLEKELKANEELSNTETSILTEMTKVTKTTPKRKKGKKK